MRSLRPRRLTVRTRIAATYSLLFFISGSAIISTIYAFMRYYPTYAISPDTNPNVSQPPSISIEPEITSLVLLDQNDILNTLLVVSLLALALLTAVTALIAWFIAGRLLRPLHEINEAARTAATGRFDHRLAVQGPTDEISELAATFNDMLSRLGENFLAHQRFAANASHELRTPLAATRALLDVATLDPNGTQPSTTGLIPKLADLNAQSVETITALLDLAAIEQAEFPLSDFRLDELIAEEIATVKTEADRASIALTASLQETVVTGNAPLLRLAIRNMLENAIRHNHEDGSVSVVLQSRLSVPDAGAFLEVVNSGPPVAPEHLALIVEPFFRGGGRVSAVGGSADARTSRGLGLALVSSIATRHGARLRINHGPSGGLRVAMIFQSLHQI